jgi:DNA-binding transcriptional LysR family regulator
MSEQVEFRHLKYIVAVAEAGNFTRAAERLFLSQPSLSKQIKDIETEIGVRIFERHRDGVYPTPIGQMVVDYAVATLYGRTHVFRLAKEIFSGTIPPLRVGFSCFVNSRHLQTFRSLYAKHFPLCSVQLSGGDTVHILQRMERGDLDCAVLCLPIPGPKWVVEPIASAPLVACMRTDDPLSERTEVGLQELVPRLTVFRDPDGHPAAHARLLEMLAEANSNVHVSCTAATPHDIQLLVRDGYGIALVNEDMPLESEVTIRHLYGVQWTADTAFVYSSDSGHPALSHIQRHFYKRSAETVRKQPQADRPQLSLKFDLTA